MNRQVERMLGASALGTVARQVLMAAGSDENEAAVVSDHLVTANLKGHDSHGIILLPAYVKNVASGIIRPNAPMRMIRDENSFLVIDGMGGFGQRIAREATDAAIRRVKTSGVVVMTIRNSHHMGRIGAYAEQCAAAGYISMFLVNVVDRHPTAAPHNGTDARLSTNPVTIGVPGSEQHLPVILDFATTMLAGGKCRVAMNRGESVAAGQLLDHKGQPTTEPGVLYREPRGSLLPMGGHKGFGLALMSELLAGALGGGTIQPEHKRRGGMMNNLFGVVIDPGRLVDLPWMHHEIAAVLDYVKASPPRDPEEPVQIAGEPERVSMERRLREGIPIDDATFGELVDTGTALGIEREHLLALMNSGTGSQSIDE